MSMTINTKLTGQGKAGGKTRCNAGPPQIPDKLSTMTKKITQHTAIKSMKKFSFLIFTLLLAFLGNVQIGNAQDCNGFVNPDFSAVTACPTFYDDVASFIGWDTWWDSFGFGELGTCPTFATAGFVGAAGYSIYSCIPGSPPFAEYVGQCLTTPWVSGQTYTISFDIYQTLGGGSIPISVLGYSGTTCPSVPFFTGPTRGDGDLCLSPGWVTLATQNENSSTSDTGWTNMTYTFTVPTDIAYMAVGTCSFPGATVGCAFTEYFAYDNFCVSALPDGPACDPTDPTADCDGDGNPNGTDPAPAAPTTADDSGTVPVGSTTTIDILSNDDYLDNSDPNNAGTTTITDTGNGTAGGTIVFDPATGELDYTPLPGEAGTTVTVEYEVCNDSSGTPVCETAVVTITVTAAPTCPDPTDTDGDGFTDCEETTGLDDPSTTANPGGATSDPNDPCDPDPTAVATGDCDGDGVPNSTDADPVDPCIPNPNPSFSSAAEAECTAGSDPFCDQSTVTNPSGTCSPSCAAGDVAPVLIKN